MTCHILTELVFAWIQIQYREAAQQKTMQRNTIQYKLSAAALNAQLPDGLVKS